MLRPAIHDFLRIAAIAAAGAILAACGSATSPTDASGGDGTAARPGAGAAAARKSEDAMVSAVSAGKPGAPVELDFEVRERPSVGKPLAIAISVTPRGTDIEALEVSFQSTEGVEVTAGASTGRRSRPADGQPIAHEITVVPQRDGVYYVSAVALVENSAGSIARTFSIPFIVGGGAAASAAIAAKAADDPRASDASGQPVKPMPATETR